MKSKKIIVIGLDGCTFTVIDKLIKKNKLPHIKKLIQNGIRSNLISTIQPSSEQAWPSFVTGLNNGKHNLFGLLKFNNDYSSRLISALDQKGDTLWDILSRQGKKSIVINMPITYPPKRINGLMVTGYFTPGKNSEYTFPKQLKKEIEKEVPGYILDIQLPEVTFDDEKNLDKFLEKIFRAIELRYKLANHLLKKYEWDFFIVVFSALDAVQHKFWSCDNPRYKTAVEKTYIKLDEKIGKLIKNYDKDYVFLVSDHGFTMLKAEIFLNIWLNKTGFLKFKKNSLKNKILTDNLLRVLQFLGRKFSIDKKRIVSKFPILNRGISSFLYKEVEWANTKAFVTGSGNIRINLKGRESKGCVAIKDYEKTRNDLINAIKHLKDPISKEKPYKQIFKREEIYKGPYLKNAPDIIILFKEEYKPSLFINDKTQIFSNNIRNYLTGAHHMKGILVANGPNIKKGVKLEDVKIIHVAPTLLHIFDTPIPKEMDGKILKEIFIKTLNPKERK